MIDVRFSSPSNLDQKNINTNTFLTTFGTIYQAETMTAYLAHRSSDHYITWADATLKPHKSDLFT